MIRSFSTFALALTLALPVQAQDTLNIVTTTGMIADAARQVGGDLVAVQELMGPGVDPHAYRQTRSDIVSAARADLVLWHGLYLEAQMESFLQELAETNPVVAVAEQLPQDGLLAAGDYDNRFDPHIWMDPSLWGNAVAVVTDALTDAMPGHAGAIEANAAAFAGDLAALESYSETVLSSVPEPARILLTAHDAFAYFGARFGFEVIGIQGISTESEAGLLRVSELVDMIVVREIGAIFVESSVSERNIRALIEGAAAQGVEVVIGGELYSDAMGPEGTYEGTYIGMMDHNITTIARALGGDAPEGGMQGMLQ